MNHDLRTSLHSLAGALDRQATLGPVEAVLARRRRRRAARRTTATLVGAAAVTGLVLGGGALADRADDPGPATTTAPDPTPTSAAQVLPDGDPSLPFGACGSLVGSPTASPQDGRVSLTLGADGGTARAGDGVVLGVSATVVGSDSGTRPGAGTLPAEGPTFVVTRDDVVVARGDLYRGAPPGPEHGGGPQPFAPGDSPLFTGQLGLTVCSTDPAAAPGEPLAAGEYVLYALAEVALADSGEAAALDGAGPTAADGPPGTRVATVVGGPRPFAVVDGPEYPPAPEPQTDALPASPWAPLACGDPAPAASPAPPLTLDHGPGPLVVPASAGELELTALLTYSGEGRLRVVAAPHATLWAVRDGVVVGALGSVGTGGTRRLDLGVGVSADASHVHPLVLACDPTGDVAAPTPGEYTLYPEIVVLGGDVVLLDGSAPRTIGAQRVFGAPVPLTVTP